VDQELSQETRGHEVGAVFKEGAGEKFAGEGSGAGQCSLRMDGVLAID
jgi:hypothetical protein